MMFANTSKAGAPLVGNVSDFGTKIVAAHPSPVYDEIHRLANAHANTKTVLSDLESALGVVLMDCSEDESDDAEGKRVPAATQLQRDLSKSVDDAVAITHRVQEILSRLSL